jgi:hypothetical protein
MHLTRKNERDIGSARQPERETLPLVSSDRSWRSWAIPLLLIALTIAAMSPLLLADFTNWDDQQSVIAALDPPSWGHLLRLCDPRPPVYMDIYIPATYAVWSALAWVSWVPTFDPQTRTHLNAYAFHGANIAVHLVSVLLVYAILKRLVKRPWAAAAGAAVYAIHPVQVEPVGWISGMKDVLCGCMGLLALWQYLRFAEPAPEEVADIVGSASADAAALTERTTSASSKTKHERPTNPPGGLTPSRPLKRTLRDLSDRSWVADAFHPLGPYLFATLAFVIAMLAKPSGVTLPLVVGCVDLFVLRRPIRRVVVAIAPWLVLAIPIVLIGHFAQPADALPYIVPWPLRPLIVADSLAFYVYKLLFPAWLGIVYGRTPAVVLFHHWEYYTWIVPAAIFVALLIARRRFPWLLGAAGMLVAATLPVLGFLPFDFQGHSTVADHYLYLAMLGPALAVAFALCTAPRSRLLAAFVIVAILLLAAQSWRQTHVWANSFTLYDHEIRGEPHLAGPYNNLAYAYEDQFRYPEAVETLEQGIQRAPDEAVLQVHLGQLLTTLGEFDKAERLLREVMPHVPKALMQQATDALAEVQRARQRAKAAAATQKAATTPSPHLTPADQRIK